MKKYCIIIVLLCLYGCIDDQKNKCNYSSDKLLKIKSTRLVVVDKFKNIVIEVKDKGIDSLRDGEYYFDSIGRLKSYKFFGSGEAYTYNEEYNAMGNVVKVEGNPLVYQSVKELHGDSIQCKFYFFALNKSFHNLNISVNKYENLVIPIQDDTIYTNMKVASFGINYQNMDSIKISLKAEYRNDCNNKTGILFDSLSLYREDR